MGNSENWRTEVTALDHFLHQQKRVDLEGRRPNIRRPSDLVGPGIAATAVRLTNFNDVLATYNGFFSAAEGALNAPTPADPYVGTISADAELGGVQMFTNLTTGVVYRRVFNRNPSDAATLYWGAWAAV